MFITFEGGEGAGKTTQIKRLAARLEADGRAVVVTREPGGTPEAEKIRDLLVRNDGGNWDALSECLLFFTARRIHVETLIKPALAAGKIVISDRFTDSTIAYQGYGHGFDRGVIADVQALSIGAFKPDLTFLLDLPVMDGLNRSKKRLGAERSNEDRFEQLDIAFHERLRNGFLTLARHDPVRFRVINAMQSENDIEKEIYSYIT